jgi:hypothetical protein
VVWTEVGVVSSMIVGVWVKVGGRIGDFIEDGHFLWSVFLVATGWFRHLA